MARQFLEFVLEVYDLTWESVVALIGDNCNTNKALANRIEKQLIGCASRRYNVVDNHIETVNEIMKKLKTLNAAAKLRKRTPLRARTRNETRWSSTFEMLLRYRKLK